MKSKHLKTFVATLLLFILIALAEFVSVGCKVNILQAMSLIKSSLLATLAIFTSVYMSNILIKFGISMVF